MMKQVVKYTLIAMTFVFITQSAFTQEIHIISATDNSPLPYATITNHTHQWVISANKNGEAKISVSVGDTLSVSYVGYKTAVFHYTGDHVQLVSLIQVQYFLPEVTIRNCRKSTEVIYKNSEATNRVKMENGTINVYSGFWSVKGVSNNVKTAVRLNPSKPNATLKDFSFWIVKERQAPKSSVLAPLIICFYDVSDNTDLPGELISNAPIIYFPKKAGKQTINLDSLYVNIPLNGIYVSFQTVFNEEYEWKFVGKLAKGQGELAGRDTTILLYGGTLGGVYAKDFDIAFYDAIKDRWSIASNLPVTNNNLHGTIKCEATIKYCEDD